MTSPSLSVIATVFLHGFIPQKKGASILLAGSGPNLGSRLAGVFEGGLVMIPLVISCPAQLCRLLIPPTKVKRLLWPLSIDFSCFDFICSLLQDTETNENDFLAPGEII